MDLKFTEEHMRSVVTKAILEGMGEDEKALIIQHAVEHLMGTPDNSSRGYPYNQDKRNRLQIAFDDALKHTLARVAREECAKPEVTEKIRALVGPVLEQAMSVESYKPIRAALAAAIVGAFDRLDR